MNGKKFLTSLLTGICWYTGLWMLCLALRETYIPPTLDSGDILASVFILAYAVKKGIE